MAEREVPAIGEASVVRPGDTLIVCVGKDVSMQWFQQFRDEALPKVKERLPGVEQIAVYRPGESDPA